MIKLFNEWLKSWPQHFALNLGQAAYDVVNIRADRHIFNSVKSFAKNMFYAIVPPCYHDAEDLRRMRKSSVIQWFLVGYNPWKYTIIEDDNLEL